jgi:hypothetical protein
MRNILLAICVLLAAPAMAQMNMYGDAGAGYRNLLLQSKSLFNKPVKDFTDAGGASRYFSDNWQEGGATTPNDVTVSTPYHFNFDFKEHELYAMVHDTSIIINNNHLKSFFLNANGFTHYFVRAPYIDPLHFFESIGYDSANKKPVMQLLKLRTIKVVKANKNAYTSNFSGEYNDKYSNVAAYYVLLPDSTWAQVKLTKRSLTEALGKYKEKVEAFFKTHSPVTEQNVDALVGSINQ